MPINAIQNVSFTSKKPKQAKENTEKKSDRYFRWVSQNQANEALKLSVGREVEDGKYKAASAFATLGAFATGMTGWFKALKTIDLANEAGILAKDEAANAAELSKIGKQIGRNKAVTTVALFATAALMMVSTVAKRKNFQKAEQTAHDRGFFTTQDRAKMKKNDEIYNRTDTVYSNFVKPQETK